MNRALFQSGVKDDWETPPDLFSELDREFHFTLDPCCTHETAKCSLHYTREDDGLSKPWGGQTVFCNPPYSDKRNDPNGQTAWIKKCYEESLNPGTTVVALIPARTDTERFHKYILGKAEIRYIQGRLKFVGASDPAPFPSMIVIWRYNKEKESLTMAPKKTENAAPAIEIKDMNVWQKLQAVRMEFLAAGSKKSGKNLHAEFTYFELVDIVPQAEALFTKYHLSLIPAFSDEIAVADVVNTDEPQQHIPFSIPIRFIAEPAKFRMNEVQGVGAVVTYYRRYLYMLVLDLVESDGFDGLPVPEEDEGQDTPSPKATETPKASRPVTPAERKEITEQLTGSEEMASAEEISELKEKLKLLLELDPEQESFIQEIALKTNSFQEIKRVACLALTENVADMLDGYTSQEG